MLSMILNKCWSKRIIEDTEYLQNLQKGKNDITPHKLNYTEDVSLLFVWLYSWHHLLPLTEKCCGLISSEMKWQLTHVLHREIML